MVPHLDVVTINAPLHPETRGLFDDELIGTMKRGAYLINTARALICDLDASLSVRHGHSSVTAMPSFVPCRPGSWPATRVTCGSRSPLRPITRGARCRTTA